MRERIYLTKCKRCGKLIISSTQNERKGDDKYAGICDNCIFGWVCPRCGRVNSPYVTQCLCNVYGRIKITYC